MQEQGVELRVLLNGEARALSGPMTIAALLSSLGLPADGVAVALNLQVVPRSQHHAVPLREGDRIEIIRAVGGG